MKFVHSESGVDPGFPRRRRRQPSRGAPTYDFAKFCEKLHEIEKILGHKGGAPPKSATVNSSGSVCVSV